MLKSENLVRIIDVSFSLFCIIFLSPLFILTCFILSITGEGEVFYRQCRIGRGGKRFWLIKFATMLKDSPNIGAGELTLPNDPRVFPFGRFLRKTKINELPQLWNLVKGDMSLIGPRPQTPNYFLLYSPEDRENILRVRPGLSGVGSIIFRNEEDILRNVQNPVDFDKRVIAPYKGRVESWFVENYSLRLYFKMIFITIIVVIVPSCNARKNLLNGIPKPPIQLLPLLS